jgi:uncharacterized membrane-anchored protein
MGKGLAILAGLIMLGFVNYGIVQRERVLTEGQMVLLQLRPVDPRSLMQGDYMRLNFAVADQAFPRFGGPERADGRIVVALDANRIATFRRIADGRPLAANEIALRYRIRGGQPRFATDAYYFEEGQAEAFEAAEYGAFRVGPDGDMILTGLRDAQLRPLMGAP